VSRRGVGQGLHGRECNAPASLDDIALFRAVFAGRVPSRRRLRAALAAGGGLSGLLESGNPWSAADDGAAAAPLARRMAAAAELVRRAMAESLREGPPLASPDAVRDYLRLSIGVRPFEVFTALFLDARHHLILAEDLFRGSVAQTSVYPREVARRCLQINASAVVLAHNHPSGAVQPSQADRELTRALVAALALVDVRVLDHLVVTRVDVYSFAEHGLL